MSGMMLNKNVTYVGYNRPCKDKLKMTTIWNITLCSWGNKDTYEADGITTFTTHNLVVLVSYILLHENYKICTLNVKPSEAKLKLHKVLSIITKLTKFCH